MNLYTILLDPTVIVALVMMAMTAYAFVLDIEYRIATKQLILGKRKKYHKDEDDVDTESDTEGEGEREIACETENEDEAEIANETETASIISHLLNSLEEEKNKNKQLQELVYQNMNYIDNLSISLSDTEKQHKVSIESLTLQCALLNDRVRELEKEMYLTNE